MRPRMDPSLKRYLVSIPSFFDALLEHCKSVFFLLLSNLHHLWVVPLLPFFDNVLSEDKMLAFVSGDERDNFSGSFHRLEFSKCERARERDIKSNPFQDVDIDDCTVEFTLEITECPLGCRGVFPVRLPEVTSAVLLCGIDELIIRFVTDSARSRILRLSVMCSRTSVGSLYTFLIM